MRAWDCLRVVLIVTVMWGGAARAEGPATSPTTAPVRAIVKGVPENLADLRRLEARVREVVARVSPAVVGLRVGGQGSGVIISEDGYVLTAGHVASAPGRPVTVILNNGRFVRAKTLGVNYGVDSALLKIVEDPPGGGKWPVAEMGTSGGLQRGEWCVALGHPGGYKFGRTPPLRLGRILDIRGNFIRTDCTLVGGDSGGPLFDLDGRVIGIHSRIGSALSDNRHVPIDMFRQTWDRLAKGEAWGESAFLRSRPGGPYLGFHAANDFKECRIETIDARSPAEAAGLRVGDVVTKFGFQRIANPSELAIYLSGQGPGVEVPVVVRREGETVTVRLTIGRRPAATAAATQPWLPPQQRQQFPEKP